MDCIWNKRPSGPRRPIDRSAFVAKFEREMRQVAEEVSQLRARLATIERSSRAEATLVIRPRPTALAA